MPMPSFKVIVVEIVNAVAIAIVSRVDETFATASRTIESIVVTNRAVANNIIDILSANLPKTTN